MSGLLITLITISTYMTAAISGTFGMAGGIILMAILLSLVPVTVAMTLHASIQLVSNSWRCFLWRKHIVWKVLPFYCMGMAAGFAVVLMTRFVPDKATVFLIIGILPMLGLLLRRYITLSIMNRKHAFFTALGLTFVHMTGGVVGALLDLLFNNTPLTRQQIVSTKAFTQTCAHIMRLAYFGFIVPVLISKEGLSGSFLPDGMEPWHLAMFLVATVAGTTSAAFILHRMNDAAFKKISIWLVTAISLYCLARGIYMVAV